MTCINNIELAVTYFERISMTALKHVIMRLMLSWQRLWGSGVVPKSGPWTPCMVNGGPVTL